MTDPIKIFRLVCLGLCAGAAAAQQAEPARQATGASGTPGYENLHGVLWIQRSAEYEATCRQVYNTASALLDAALADSKWTACVEQVAKTDYAELPPAIVVDVDETVLDNSAFQARLIHEGGDKNSEADQPGRFTPAKWARWVGEQQAPALPGALAFLQAAAKKGVTVFYVTNRDAALEVDTRANLAALGFPLPKDDKIDVLLTRGEHDAELSEKSPRRRKVVATHRVVMMFGDDLGDFLPGVKPVSSGADAATKQREAREVQRDRLRLTRDYGSWWGTRWFVLPNPMYGSWERTVRYEFPDRPAALQTDGPRRGAAGTAREPAKRQDRR